MDVFGVLLTGLFTGLGVVFGQWIWDKFIKHRLEKNVDKLNGGVKMAKFCKKCGIKIKEPGFTDNLLGTKIFYEFEDGIYCFDCADDRKRNRSKKE